MHVRLPGCLTHVSQYYLEHKGERLVLPVGVVLGEVNSHIRKGEGGAVDTLGGGGGAQDVQLAPLVVIHQRCDIM
eukprot:8711807-Pyramimonas_sp.AAC.1